jgi:broad specificity phosphatase PhoE
MAADACWLYLVRHGATDNNCAIPPRLQGRRTDPPLSVAGREQARRTGLFLSKHRVDAVYSSPLLRARQTAEAIAEPHGLIVQQVPALTEVDVGVWEGRCWEEIAQSDPEAYHAFMSDPCAHPYLEGENLNSVQLRVAPAFQQLLADNLGRMIVVVAHNVVNRAYLAQLLHMPLGLYRGIPQDNCGLTLLCYRGGQIKPVTINEVFHLGQPE